MCSKPNKAMETHLQKCGIWIEDSSSEILAFNLQSRYGGNIVSWRDEVKDAIKWRLLVEEIRNGKRGYRTVSSSEYADLVEQRDESKAGTTQRQAVSA